jgi:hypothetical protein
MAGREVGDYVFGRELERLRLMGVKQSDDRDDESAEVDPGSGNDADRLAIEAARIRRLFDRFLRAQQFYNMTHTGREAITDSRLRSLFATYMLYGPYTPPELVGTGGRGLYAPSTLGKDLRQLGALGLPPAGLASIDVQSWLEDYMTKLRAVMPGLRTDLPDAPDDLRGWIRDVPWADDDAPDDWEGEQPVDVAAPGFDDLLDGLDDDDVPVDEPVVETAVT